MAICNIASAGFFSSDRAVCEYAKDIWGVKPSWDIHPDPHIEFEVVEPIKKVHASEKPLEMTTVHAA